MMLLASNCEYILEVINKRAAKRILVIHYATWPVNDRHRTWWPNYSVTWLYVFENMFVKSKFPHFFSLPLKFMLAPLEDNIIFASSPQKQWICQSMSQHMADTRCARSVPAVPPSAAPGRPGRSDAGVCPGMWRWAAPGQDRPAPAWHLGLPDR